MGNFLRAARVEDQRRAPSLLRPTDDHRHRCADDASSLLETEAGMTDAGYALRLSEGLQVRETAERQWS